MHKFHLLLIFLFLNTCLIGQYSHQDILFGESGNTLLNNLILSYKPITLPTYSTAKDNMFKYVFEENDTVTCVYTGLKRYLPPFGDPSNEMFDNASNISIDTEHTYPQSKTSNDAGKSDLHHMFPTRSVVNNGRGSIPFGEISTNNIDKWYLEDQTLSTAPANNIHLYSKQDNNVMFEPRDDHKGNVARAMFYYYTMYKSNADAVDPNYFNNQKAKLCQWHLDDPVDSLEWIRTSRISWYQGFRVNPFVMDCTLPFRCGYCTSSCTPPNGISEINTMGLEHIEVFPNPFIEQTKISFLLKRPQNIQLEIFNNIGQKITTLAQGEYSEGLHQITFIPDNLSDGIYYYKLIIGNKHQYTTLSNALILAK